MINEESFQRKTDWLKLQSDNKRIENVSTVEVNVTECFIVTMSKTYLKDNR